MSEFVGEDAEPNQLNRIEHKLDHILSFLGHAQKVATGMARHPMFASMIPADIRKQLADKD